MGNEGLGWDYLLKMVHNPCGNWHPGQGATPKKYTPLSFVEVLACLVEVLACLVEVLAGAVWDPDMADIRMTFFWRISPQQCYQGLWESSVLAASPSSCSSPK